MSEESKSRMDHMKHDQAIPYFVELQRRLYDIFLYVSCHERNFATYSIKIESLFVDAASFFDSLTQTFIIEQVQSGREFKAKDRVPQFNAKIERTDYFNAGDYRVLLEKEFKLSSKEVSLNAYEDNLHADTCRFIPEKNDCYLIRPFACWAEEKGLFWWKAYTTLKHNRLANSTEATLKNTIYALAGTFIVLSMRHIDVFTFGRRDVLYELFLPYYWIVGSRIVANLDSTEPHDV